MRMRRSHNIRPGPMDLRMDHEARLVDGVLRTAESNVAVCIDKDEIRRFHSREVFSEWVDPEVVA